MRSRIVSVGYEIVGGTPESFAEEMRADYERYGRLVKELRVQAG